MFHQADLEGRDLDPEERAEVKSLLDRAKSAKEIDDIGRQLGAPMTSGFNGARFGGGPGDMFVKSEGWRRVADPASRGQQWSTGPVEITPLTKAGTLFEGSGGQGAGFVPTPQVVPGVVPKLLEPLGVADVFGQAVATTSSIRYMLEGTATSGAAGVAEGGTKPPSDIAVSTIDEPIKKVATVLTISDELAEDAASVQAYLNGRLVMFVRLEEERQLLRGAGTNELVGVFGRSGINTYTRLGTDDNATSLAKVLANTAGSSFVQPDTVIMHPSNWLNTRLLRDGTGGTVGAFYAGGPFSSYYNGGETVPGLFGQMLWNTKVVLSNYVGAGTALVGNFGQAAQLYRRGGPTVEVSNSHASYFQSNMLMLRCESRLGLAVYRPSAFTAVSGLA
jgi:HK97 family phage major capsid protein